MEAPRAEPLRDREDDLSVRNGLLEQCLLEPERPEGEPLGVATWTEVPALAGEGEQVLMGQASQRTRAKPWSRMPHSRNFSASSYESSRNCSQIIGNGNLSNYPPAVPA